MQAAETFARLFDMTCDDLESSKLNLGGWHVYWRTGTDEELDAQPAVYVVNVDRWISEGERVFMSWRVGDLCGSTLDPF